MPVLYMNYLAQSVVCANVTLE